MRAWSMVGFDSRPRNLILKYAPAEDDDGYGYWQAFSEAWASDQTVVNVEWDMEFTEELAAELLNCPHPRCTHAYQCHRPSTFWAHKTGSPAGSMWVRPGQEWASWSAIGFCKIAADVRGVPPERSHWLKVEEELNRALREHAGSSRGLWHVHWPGVEHYHYRDGVRRMSQTTATDIEDDDRESKDESPRRGVVLRGGRWVEIDVSPVREMR